MTKKESKNKKTGTLKKILFIISIIIIILILLGFITYNLDKKRVTNLKKPIYTIKTISKDGNKVTYIGLGYKVIRYISVSPNEPFENSFGIKIGSWFMKYELDFDPTRVLDDLYKKSKEVNITPTENCYLGPQLYFENDVNKVFISCLDSITFYGENLNEYLEKNKMPFEQFFTGLVIYEQKRFDDDKGTQNFYKEFSIIKCNKDNGKANYFIGTKDMEYSSELCAIE